MRTQGNIDSSFGRAHVCMRAQTHTHTHTHGDDLPQMHLVPKFEVCGSNTKSWPGTIQQFGGASYKAFR